LIEKGSQRVLKCEQGTCQGMDLTRIGFSEKNAQMIILELKLRLDSVENLEFNEFLLV
jgi:hypothetical protein